MSEKTTLPATSVPIFARLKLAVLEIQELSFGAKCLHGRLLLFAGKNGFCNPSHETLAKSIGIKSDRQVRRLLAELKSFGLISWTQTKTSCSYTVWDGEELPAWTNTSTTPGHICPVNLDKSVLQKEVLKEVRKDVNVKSSASSCADVIPKRKPARKSIPLGYEGICKNMGIIISKDWNSPYIINSAIELAEIADEVLGEHPSYVQNWLYRLVKRENGITPGTDDCPFHTNWFRKAFKAHCKQESEDREFLADEDVDWDEVNRVKEIRAQRRIA